MSKVLKRISFLLAMLMVCLTFCPMTSYADVPYQTFSQNGYGEYIKSQTAYTPYETIYKITDAETNRVYYLNAPEDMAIDEEGNIYVADTGNNRVIVSDKEGNLITVIGGTNADGEKIKDESGKDLLYEPTGIFVDKGLIYVAVPRTDRRAKEGLVRVFDMEGNHVRDYSRPNNVLFGKDSFKPKKLIVDAGGYLYIVSEGNTNGIINLTPGGEFLGYFGTSEIVPSFLDIVYNIILTDEQQASRAKKVPQSLTNLCLDRKGIVYTLVEGVNEGTQPLRKLNKAGTNMLLLEVMPYNGIAVSVGQYDNIYVATNTGMIYEYNKEGNLLFCFGGEDNDITYRNGLFMAGAIKAIGVDSEDNVYVLDCKSNTIQSFQTTEFTDYVHRSLYYYQKGDYVNTKLYLEKVMDMNSMFDYANQAMGLTLFREERFAESMEFYRLAKDKIGYSDSYWEIRNEWLNKNIIVLLLSIVALYFVLKILGKLDKKFGIFNFARNLTAGMRSTITYKRLTFGKRFFLHPIDGSYDVKHENIASIGISSVLVILYMLIYIINKYFSGFIFKMARDGRYNLVGDIGLFVIGFTAAASITYLICTINDGEGRFKEIFSGIVYAFTPYLIIQPMLFVASQVLTLNESFIIEFGNIIMITLIAILVFMAIKEINNYTVKETFKVIGLTLFAALVFALIIFVIYILSQQLVNFVRSIYGEVVYRLGL